MNKEELLQELSSRVNTGEISRQEILTRLDLRSSINSEDAGKNLSHFSVTKMLYILGTIIVVLGVLFFTWQIWEDIGSLARVSITLGMGLLITALGSMLLKKRPEENVGMVFQAIGGLLIPGGAIVALSELQIQTVSSWPLTLVFGAIFLFYLLINFVHRNAILVFFAIANGTVTLYLLVESMIGGSFYLHGELYAYLTMVVGLCYLLLGHAFRVGKNMSLTGILYFLGTAAFLGAGFSRVFDSSIWRMIFFLVVIAGFALAARVRSRGILAVSTIFLLAHISYITGKYFADSIGWPICLILLGFIFIGLGYASITFSKKYIRNSAV